MHQIDYKICQTTAKECYAGKTMPDGSSMLDHCVRLSNIFARMRCYEIAAIALLHEVLPNKIMTVEELIKLTVFSPVVHASNFMIQRQDETCIDYIVRLSQDPAAASVKAVDLPEHMLMGCTERELREYQHSFLLLSGWAPRNMMVDAVYDHLEVPKQMRGYGPEYEENE